MDKGYVDIEAVPNSLDDVKCLWRNTFDKEKREIRLKSFEDGKGDPQINTLISTMFGTGTSRYRSILDYGCGKGAFIMPVVRCLPDLEKYICVNKQEGEEDPNKDLAESLSKSGLNLSIFELKETDSFENESPIKPDAIIVMDVLHEIPLTELPQRILSLCKCLSRDGILFIAELERAPLYEPDAVWWDEIDIRTVFPKDIFGVEILTLPTKHEFPFTTVKITRKTEDNLEIDSLTNLCVKMYKSKSQRVLKQICENGNRMRKLTESEADKNQLSEVLKEFWALQVLYSSISKQVREYAKSLPQIPVGEHGYSICFRQTNIGTSRETLKFLDSTLETSRSKLLLSLGQYDIISITRFEDLASFEEALLPSRTVKNVINMNSMICFDWGAWQLNGKYVEVSPDLDSFDQPFWGICFLKVNDHQLRLRGIHEEFDIIRSLTNPNTKHRVVPENTRISILGGLGWNELIVIVNASDPKDIFKFSTKVRDFISRVFQDNTTAEAVFSSTFTVVGIDPDMSDEVDRVLEDQDILVEFTVKPGCTSKIVSEVSKKYSPLVHCVLGKRDLECHPKGKNFLSGILDFREENKEYLLMTSSSFLFDPRKLPEDHINYVKVSRLDIPNYDIEQIEPDYSVFGKYPAIIRRLRQMISQFCACVCDPLTTNEVLDVRNCVEEISDFISNNEDAISPEGIGIISHTIRMVLYGLQQRYQGTYSTIYNLNEVNMTGINTGIQRIIKAANAIPSQILKQCRFRWNGFTMFDYTDLPFRLNFGIMSLPGKDVIDPANWLWYIHEIGHQYFWDVETRNLLPIYEEQLNLSQGDIIEDILADIFMYRIAFDGDLDRFLDTQWESHYRDRFTVESERKRHLRRLFAMYTYHKTTSNLSKASYSREGTLNIYHDFASELTKYGYDPIDLLPKGTDFLGNTNTEENEKYDIEVKFLQFLLGHLKRWHWFFDEADQARLFSFVGQESNISEDVAALLAGRILTQKVENPGQIICRLNEMDNPPLKANIAIILSLWNTWITEAS